MPSRHLAVVGPGEGADAAAVADADAHEVGRPAAGPLSIAADAAGALAWLERELGDARPAAAPDA